MTELDTRLIDTAYEQIAVLHRAVRWTKLQIRVIIVMFSLLLIGSGLIGYLFSQQVSLSDKIQSGAIAACEQANTERATDEQNWNFFMGILLKGNTNASDIAFGKEILQHVAEGDAPANCRVEYGN